MDDLISRQDAIDTISHHGEIESYYTGLYSDGYCDGVYDAVDVLKDLPSAQPEIIRCKDCKHRETENGFCEGRGWPMQLVPDNGFCDKGERSEDERIHQD